MLILSEPEGVRQLRIEVVRRLDEARVQVGCAWPRYRFHALDDDAVGSAVAARGKDVLAVCALREPSASRWISSCAPSSSPVRRRRLWLRPSTTAGLRDGKGCRERSGARYGRASEGFNGMAGIDGKA